MLFRFSIFRWTSTPTAIHPSRCAVQVPVIDTEHLSHMWKSKCPFGGFLKWWYPQIIHFNRVFHYKPSILGYHNFWKPPFLLLVFVANFDRSPEMLGLFWGINHDCSVRNYCKRKVTILKPCIVLLGFRPWNVILVGCPAQLQHNRRLRKSVWPIQKTFPLI